MSDIVQSKRQPLWLPNGGRQRIPEDKYIDGVSVWDWCKPDASIDNHDNLAEADAFCASRGCTLLAPPAYNNAILTIKQPIVMAAPRIVGNYNGTVSGSMWQYVPATPPADLTVGFSFDGSFVENVSFLGNDAEIVQASSLLTTGIVPAWGPNGVTSRVDAALYLPAGKTSPQMAALYPGVIAAGALGASTFWNCQFKNAKFGFLQNSHDGHVWLLNCHAIGAIAGVYSLHQGQDHYFVEGGLQGALAGMVCGNTDWVNINGGWNGTIDRVHFFGAAYGILQMQDDPNNSGFSGTNGSYYNVSFEEIGERFLMFDPAGDSGLNLYNFNAGWAIDQNNRLPLALRPPNGDQMYNIEVGSINKLSSNVRLLAQDESKKVLRISGVDAIGLIDPQGFIGGGIDCTGDAQGFVLNDADTNVARKADQSWSRDFLTVGNVLPDPEFGLTAGAAPVTGATIGHWSVGADASLQANTLAGWIAAGTALDMPASMLKYLPKNYLIFKAVNLNTGLSNSIGLSFNNTANLPGTRAPALSIFLTNSATGPINLSSSSFQSFYTNAGEDYREYANPALLRFYRLICRNAPVSNDNAELGFFSITPSPFAPLYFCCPMVSWGEEAPYNRSPGPSLGNGVYPVASAGLAPGSLWVDTAAGNVLKVV